MIFSGIKIFLAQIFGIQAKPKATTQPGNYRTRGHLNKIPHLDQIRFHSDALIPSTGFSVIGLKVVAHARGGDIVGQFQDGSAAVVSNTFGKGRSIFVATTPGISYIKDAKFAARELAEKWPVAHRNFINHLADQSGANRALLLSHPVVEAGGYEAPKGVAVVLANFTYEPVERLEVILPVRQPVRLVRLASSMTPVEFKVISAAKRFKADGYHKAIQFTIKLGLDEIVLME